MLFIACHIFIEGGIDIGPIFPSLLREEPVAVRTRMEPCFFQVISPNGPLLFT